MSTTIPQNVYLSKINAHPRDKNIVFDEGPHIYTVCGQQGYTSVTTFIHSHFPHFDADKIIHIIIHSKKYREDSSYKYYNMTADQIRNQWNENGAQASGAGTKMHFNIECFMNQEIVEEETGNPVLGATHADLVQVCDFIDTSTEWKYFIQYALDFPHFVPYRTEWFIYDEELKLAGSIDMVYINPEEGTYSIYDWKRVKSIEYEAWGNKKGTTPDTKHLPDSNFWHYSLQLNLYKALLERNYGIQIKELCLVVLHPDAANYDIIPCADLSKEIKAMLATRLAKLAV